MMTQMTLILHFNDPLLQEAGLNNSDQEEVTPKVNLG